MSEAQQWPEGMSLVAYEFGGALSSAGLLARVELDIEMVVDGASYLIWTATGTALRKSQDTVEATLASIFTLPAVDQLGVEDSSGASFQFWSYKVTTRTYRDNIVETEVRQIQPLLSMETTQILSALPVGGVGVPEIIGDPNGGVTPEYVTAAIQQHRNEDNPHPAYDAAEDFSALYENGLI